MNQPLLTFVTEFREPATTAELWTEIAMVRGWAKAADLPSTFSDLDAELRLLALRGLVACVDGKWRPVVKAQKREALLFE